MRNFIVVLAVLAIALASCQKKTYTCECVDIGGPRQFEIKASGQKAAEKKCESYTNNPEVCGPMCRLKN